MKWDKICLMIPTYGRWNGPLRMCIESAYGTAENIENLYFCFCINRKDKKTEEFLKSKEVWPAKLGGWEIIYEDTDSPNLSKYYNMLYEQTKFNSPETVVSMIGDDMFFCTHGWDTKILSLINNYNGIGVFWGDDAYIARERMCVNLFVTRKMVEATEEPFMCPMFKAEMIDVVWRKVAKYTKTAHFLPDVIIRHNHNTRMKENQRDETFKRLAPVQAEARKKRAEARAYAAMIAERLKEKGFIGDSVD